MNNDYMLFAIAMIPVLWLIISLGVLKMPAHKNLFFHSNIDINNCNDMLEDEVY